MRRGRGGQQHGLVAGGRGLAAQGVHHLSLCGAGHELHCIGVDPGGRKVVHLRQGSQRVEKGDDRAGACRLFGGEWPDSQEEVTSGSVAECGSGGFVLCIREAGLGPCARGDDDVVAGFDQEGCTPGDQRHSTFVGARLAVDSDLHRSRKANWPGNRPGRNRSPGQRVAVSQWSPASGPRSGLFGSRRPVGHVWT